MRYLMYVLLAVFSVNGLAHEGWKGSRADAHAPLGVMGDHYHKKGEWMFSYRFMQMNMGGNRDGTNDLSTQQVFSRGFMVAPLKMETKMHMFGAMFAVSDKLTLMAMIPHVTKKMDHITMGGMRFTTRAEGVGDSKITALYSLVQKADKRIHLNLGLSLPTGSIDKRDDTPAMANAKLPYPMQLGSGTTDLIIGSTLMAQAESVSWGIQGLATIRTGENDNNYRLGHEFNATAWIAKNISHTSSVSFRMNYKRWNDIKGSDPDLNPNMVPTARTDLRAGDRIDALLGFNYYAKEGMLKGHRFSIEVGMPVYQDLDGPQLKAKSQILIGWQYAIK